MAGGSDHETESLAEPADDEEIYGARGADVPPHRPIMQGDVFEGVAVRGYEGPRDVAILTHPCTMRGADGQLKERLSVAEVTSYQYLPPRSWPGGHYGVFPLPGLREEGAEHGHGAVVFEEIFSIDSAELDPARRIAHLSSRGVYIFQQRFLCSLSRVVVPLARVREACEHVLEEADLLEEWLERLAGSPEAFAEQTAAFTELMDGGLREALEDASRRPQVRREVLREIRSRERSAAEGAGD